jgi:hypothetical protein
MIAHPFAPFIANTTTADSQLRPSVGTLANGNFVIVWEENPQTTGKAQVFDRYGGRIGNAVTVATPGDPIFKDTQYLHVTGQGNGGFFVSWMYPGFDFQHGPGRVYGQAVGSDGISTGNPILLSNAMVRSDESAVTTLSNGTIANASTFESYNNIEWQVSIRATLLKPDQTTSTTLVESTSTQSPALNAMPSLLSRRSPTGISW